jgi:hypothetical protein
MWLTINISTCITFPAFRIPTSSSLRIEKKFWARVKFPPADGPGPGTSQKTAAPKKRRVCVDEENIEMEVGIRTLGRRKLA